jgi:hypothetical protein
LVFKEVHADFNFAGILLFFWAERVVHLTPPASCPLRIANHCCVVDRDLLAVADSLKILLLENDAKFGDAD